MTQNRYLLGALATLMSLITWSAQADIPDDVQKALRNVQNPYMDMREAEMRELPNLPGVIEISDGMNFAYAIGGGGQIFFGELFDADQGISATENQRAQKRLKLIQKYGHNPIVFPATGAEKAKVQVFTDVTCGFCQRLHKEMAEYNALGITVEYLAFPRSEPGQMPWALAETAWCSKDPKESLTQLKLGVEIPIATCAINPVKDHHALVRKLQLRGTPAIITASGELFPGYVPPIELAKLLQLEK